MPTVTLTVHRATQTIGGNCIEIATSEGNRLILAMGRPLDAPREATGLLPETLDVSSPVDGVLVFVNWSAQNIDRTVTLYRACLKTQRTLVVDLYTADVIETLAKFGKIPQPDWNGMRVLITSGLSKRYKQTGRAEFVDRMAKNGIGVSHLHASKNQWVVMTRSALMRDFQRKGIVIDEQDAWSWSNWRGYLAEPQGAALQAWFDDGGARANHIHTSGHASTADLKAFSSALNPKTLVPIHGLGWDDGHPGFPAISRLGDGEVYVL